MLNIIGKYMMIGAIEYLVICTLMIMFSEYLFGMKPLDYFKKEVERINAVSILGILIFTVLWPWYTVVYFVNVYNRVKNYMANND